jgi:hypothetical protein
MKAFITRYYHLVLLGISFLVISLSILFLLSSHHSLKDSLDEHYDAKISESASSKPTPSALEALERLGRKTLWKAREDGASPLVSRLYLLKDGQLIDPMTGSQSLYPPVPNQWLIDKGLDYTDMNILDRDPKGKGFTVLEEFQAGTDPNDPKQYPPLFTKLGYAEQDIRQTRLLFDFLGEEENEGRKEYRLRPAQAFPLPNPAKGDRPDTSTRNVIMGETIPGAPFLKVIGYEDRKKNINDTEYDVSELALENTLTGEKHLLVKKNTSREYKLRPIDLIESVILHYQLAGAPEELITVERGKVFTLGSLDKNYTETYKLKDFSSEGILLEKAGKPFTVKPSGSAAAATPTAPPASAP